jgi:hypothetical protein
MLSSSTSYKPQIVWVTLAMALLACGKPPAQEISDADSAVQAAEAVGAAEFAVEELILAQDALADAKAKMESRDFNGARIAALEAKARADAAREAVEINKQNAKAEAEERMKTLKPQIEAFQEIASKMRSRAADPWKTEAVALKDQWAAIQADFDQGHYNMAIDKMDAVQDKLDEFRAAQDSAPASPGRR